MLEVALAPLGHQRRERVKVKAARQPAVVRIAAGDPFLLAWLALLRDSPFDYYLSDLDSGRRIDRHPVSNDTHGKLDEVHLVSMWFFFFPHQFLSHVVFSLWHGCLVRQNRHPLNERYLFIIHSLPHLLLSHEYA